MTPDCQSKPAAMTASTMQDIAAGWEGDHLTCELESIPLLASPEIDQFFPTLDPPQSPTTNTLLEELFEEPAGGNNYPSPDMPPLTDPYPLARSRQTPSQPPIDWPALIDIPNLDDLPNLDDIPNLYDFPALETVDAGQTPIDATALDKTNNGQIPFDVPPTQATALMVDPSFLLYGSRIPNPGRLYTPLPPLDCHSPTGNDCSDPEDLALSSAEQSPRREKTPRRDNAPVKPGLELIKRPGWGVDREKPWIKTNTTKGKNTRAAKIADYRPEDHYTALACAPASWQDFTYTTSGELEAGKTYTADQLNRYLFQHPLHHGPDGNHDPKHSGLRIRIQKNPADSARRYPTYTSSRCRFAACYGKHNCINQGQYRVAFDEQSHRAPATTDPQLNAGYVHLYCLEKHLDLPAICARLHVLVENRELPREPGARNRMRLGQSAALENVAQGFIAACETGARPSGYPRRGEWRHEGSLTHKLCLAKIEEDGPHRLRKIRERDEKASNYTVHLGNLEVESEERAKTRMHANQQKPGGAKRKGRVEESGGEGEGDGDGEAGRPRAAKRTARGRR